MSAVTVTRRHTMDTTIKVTKAHISKIQVTVNQTAFQVHTREAILAAPKLGGSEQILVRVQEEWEQ